MFDGKDITHAPAHTIAGLGIARTFQNIELFANATLLQNLLIGRHCHSTVGYLSQIAFLPSTRRAEIQHREKVEEVIAFLDLQRYRDYADRQFALRRAQGGRTRPGAVHRTEAAAAR